MKYLTMKKYIMHIHIVVMKDKVTKITTDSIRRFLPKGTINTTHQRVAFIENWINNYPKKLFNYKTPLEIFSIG